MKTKKCIAIAALFTLIFINSANSENNQQAICLTDKDCSSLYAPIIFTSGGLTKFLKGMFNRREYVHNVIPHDLSHFIQCFDYAQNKFGKRMYGRHVLRIFTHKLRAAPYISDKAFLTMLTDVLPVVQRYMDNAEHKVASSIKQSINKMLYDTFLRQFEQFKTSPQDFFDSLAHDITVIAYDPHAYYGDVSIDEFRHAFTRFLEVGLSKIVWHAEDGLDTWRSVKQIATKLEGMTDTKVCGDDDLYELHDTLLERYCYFLDIVTPDMKPGFFDELKRTIASESLNLLDHEELELCLESRRERINNLLLECTFKISASQQGFILG
jgi:hypothetical protein